MKILFICTGNANRSALAETVLKKMLNDTGLPGIDVASCGTKAHGVADRDSTMRCIAAEHGYQLEGKPTPMTEEILEQADLIIVMTEQHRNEVTRLLSYNHWNRIIRFNGYCFREKTDLPDPHYQTEQIYRSCFDAIERGCREIARKLRQPEA